ncbi:MAG TPA: hypothetical protein VF395_15965 [Polyangiaceae bacterium]
MNDLSAWLHRVALGMLLAVVILGALTARIVARGEAELRRSDVAFNRGDLREAVLYARRAAALYAPGAPHVPSAYARLSAVALGAEASGEPEVARQAWGAMRGAALETRHLWTPHAADLDRANANLARLASAPASVQNGDHGRATPREMLARDDAPQAAWILVLGAGFGLFAAGLGLFALLGLTPSGKISGNIGWAALALTAMGVACWTLAVYRA